MNSLAMAEQMAAEKRAYKARVTEVYDAFSRLYDSEELNAMVCEAIHDLSCAVLLCTPNNHADAKKMFEENVCRAVHTAIERYCEKA